MIVSKTLNRDLTSLEVSNPYPIPEELERKELEKKLNWQPLAYDEDTRTRSGSPIPPRENV